jgi:aryl-alcohol dehydrogenase-like predicted oxidoreductase
MNETDSILFGISANDWDPHGPVNLIKSDRVDMVQVIYKIFEQRPAEKMFPVALENRIGIIAPVPFEEGLLTRNLGPDYFESMPLCTGGSTPAVKRKSNKVIFLSEYN